MRSHSPRHDWRAFGRALLVTLAAMLILGTCASSPAAASPTTTPRDTVVATWYGPGFYGNPFACSARSDVPDRYSRNVRGVAHMTLPCGTRITVCRGHRCRKTLVIDRGNFPRLHLDLTARLAMDLCACEKPHTQMVRYRRGW